MPAHYTLRRTHLFLLVLAALIGPILAGVVGYGLGYAPPKLKELFVYKPYDDSLEAYNKAYAMRNPYFFTDTLHSYMKDRRLRIAMLGDSYVWGDGIPWEDTWNHKLGNLLVRRFGAHQVEVLHWGRNGWSTRDQLHFLCEEGLRYQPDLIVLGVVVNDPDYFTGAGQQRVRSSGGIDAWMDSLYTKENLKHYRLIWQRLQHTLAQDSIPLAVVLFPSVYDTEAEAFVKLRRFLASLELPHFYDLTEAYQASIGRMQEPWLRANAVNWHASPLLTHWIASETYPLLVQHPVLAPLDTVAYGAFPYNKKWAHPYKGPAKSLEACPPLP